MKQGKILSVCLSVCLSVISFIPVVTRPLMGTR